MVMKLTANTVYVKVFQNRFEIRHIESGKTCSLLSPKAFTTKRLLVGQFAEADATLRKGMRQLVKNGWFVIRPIMVIHPMEKTEGGLSEVEERIFKELAAGVGARKSVVWIGHELSDAEVLSKTD
jgi:hypothetical protein